MKEEIKEIELWKEKTKGIFHITEYTRFWNYITNLQQAIKDTKDTADDMLYELKQENERLQENNQNMQEEMCRCWQRIDKAVEYIKNNSLYTEDYDYDEEENLRWLGAHDYKESEDLLNILQDKEEV